MQDIPITIITPTTGKESLYRLIDSLEAQPVSWVHILLWDEKKEGEFVFPNSETMQVKLPRDVDGATQRGFRYGIEIPGRFVSGVAAGSALRSVGMMAASTPLVTFADDDVWFEPNHLENMLKIMQGKEWAYCRRKIWEDKNKCIGIDDFESVGDSSSRKVPYEMVDNNTLIFSQRFGTSAAVLYRETKQYNDDRLMYAFLKKYAGEPGKSEEATVNQVCPEKLREMFKQHCTPCQL